MDAYLGVGAYAGSYGTCNRQYYDLIIPRAYIRWLDMPLIVPNYVDITVGVYLFNLTTISLNVQICLQFFVPRVL